MYSALWQVRISEEENHIAPGITCCGRHDTSRPLSSGAMRLLGPSPRLLRPLRCCVVGRPGHALLLRLRASRLRILRAGLLLIASFLGMSGPDTDSGRPKPARPEPFSVDKVRQQHRKAQLQANRHAADGAVDAQGANLHWGQHCEEAVPGAAKGRRPSHVQGQADGRKEQEAAWRTVLHTGLICKPYRKACTDWIRRLSMYSLYIL